MRVGPSSTRRGQSSDGYTERAQLLERLQNLRAILPVFAQEVASARRQAAELCVQNRRLMREVRQLQRAHQARADTQPR